VANLNRPFELIACIAKLVTEAQDANWEFGRDLEEQADRLEKIADTASLAAQYFAEINAAIESVEG
jgi:hypothetical protein